MKKLLGFLGFLAGVLAVSTAHAALTLPASIDMGPFETVGGLILAAAVGFLVFRKIRGIFKF